MLTTPQLRALWGPDCTKPAGLTVFTFWTGAKATVRDGTEWAWAAHDQVMHFHDYYIRPKDTGAYNCRAITGGTLLSLHSFGIACDTNWLTNPYGPTLRTDRSPALINDLAAIRTIDGLQVFRWGGTYSGNKDAMHDEICIAPAQLARGINWDSVVGTKPPDPPPIPDPPVKPPRKPLEDPDMIFLNVPDIGDGTGAQYLGTITDAGKVAVHIEAGNGDDYGAVLPIVTITVDEFKSYTVK